MGRIFRNMGEIERAHELIRQAVEVHESSGAKPSFEMFDAYNVLGTVYAKDERWGDAVEALTKALELGESLLDPSTPDGAEDLASVLKNLGDAQLYYGFPKAAEQHLLRSIQLRESVNSRWLARSIGSLANLHRREGDYDEAINLLARSLELRRANYPPESSSVGFGCFFLARALAEADRPEEARPLFEEAIKIWSARLQNPNHPDLRNAIFRFAEVLAKLDVPSEADAMFRRAIQIDEHNHGAESEEVAVSLEGLARFLDAQGRSTELEAIQGRIRAIRRENTSENGA
jgi:tetratricopeptide (TPR) repeat protein